MEAKVINLTWYVLYNVTMAINKLQRSRLTFDLSAKVLILESIIIYLNKIFSETIGPIELKFHM